MSAEAPIFTPHLTERETEVLHAFGRGLTNKQVAYELGLSQRTIEIHASTIRDKAGISAGRAVFGLWYARTFPAMAGITAAPRELTALELDAAQLLEVVRGLMRNDPRARAMARAMLDRHSGEVEL